MKESIDVIKGALWATWNQIPWLQYVLYVAIAVILVLEKNKTKKFCYGVFSALLLIMLFNPITVKCMKPFFGATWVYYCRLFLIIPIPVIMAYGLTLGFTKFKFLPKLILVMMFTAVMIFRGDYIYDDVNFKRAENFSKVPKDIVQLKNLLSNVQGYKRVLISSKINIYIRQIDASIILPFGRIDGGNTISDQIDSEDPDAEYVINYVLENNCDYFMAKRSDHSIKMYLEKGCSVIGYTDNYVLFRYNDSPVRTYDKYGNLASVTYTDASGGTEMCPIGYVTVCYSYDIEGRRTGEFYEDENNEPVMLDSGYASVKYIFNRLGKLIETAYYDDSMELTVNNYGFAVMQSEYNDDNYEIKRTYLDDERKPVVVSKYGYAIVRFERAPSGEIVKELYYDEFDKLIELPEGYCGYEQIVSRDKKTIELTYLDHDGKPVLTSLGYATIRRELNERGNAISTRFFDENGRPTSLGTGEYGYDSVYDELGREIERIYVDQEGEAMIIEGGYSYFVYERDSDGTVIRTIYFDLDGNVVEEKTVE